MASEKNHKYVWFTNEKCEVTGTYFSNCCGIRFEINFKAGDMFVRCPSCRKEVEWKRINPD
jgi:hypothetical protein